MRKEEFTAFSIDGVWNDANDASSKKVVKFTIIYSTKAFTVIEAILNLSKTLFICFVLAIAAHYFTKDAATLVLEPLERMIEKV